MNNLILTSPFDAHVHWRQQNTIMGLVAPYTINQFAGSLLMPNTDPKILGWKDLRNYSQQVFRQIEKIGEDHFALLTYYLSPNLSKEDFDFANSDNYLHKLGMKLGGVKYYPKGGTTNSEMGMNGFDEVSHVLKYMQDHQIPLLIHGEAATDSQGFMIDDFHREEVFYETEMENLRKRFPELPLVMEHITTQQAVEFVLRHDNVRATITPQHLLFDRRALFNGVTTNDQSFYYDSNKNGMNPAQMCRPILKSERHVDALRKALIMQRNEGLRKLGLGTDSAAHTPDKKYCECGACGVFSAPIALQLYAMAFEEMEILDHLQAFAGEIMPEFYNIKDKLPHKQISLGKCEMGTEVQDNYHGIVTPFAGQKLSWKTYKVH